MATLIIVLYVIKNFFWNKKKGANKFGRGGSLNELTDLASQLQKAGMPASQIKEMLGGMQAMRSKPAMARQPRRMPKLGDRRPAQGRAVFDHMDEMDEGDSGFPSSPPWGQNNRNPEQDLADLDMGFPSRPPWGQNQGRRDELDEPIFRESSEESAAEEFSLGQGVHAPYIEPSEETN